MTYAILSSGGATYRLISQLTSGPNKAGLFGSQTYLHFLHFKSGDLWKPKNILHYCSIMVIRINEVNKMTIP